MANAERVMQRPHHHIDHMAIAHARAPTLGWQNIGAAAHHLDAASQDGFRVAKADKLNGADNGLQAAATKPVDLKGRCRVGQTGTDRNTSG